jgi:hypothetical protein
MDALYEIINNSRLLENHPNVLGLRAVQFDKYSSTKHITNVRLMFDLIEGQNLKEFILDEDGKYKSIG